MVNVYISVFVCIVNIALWVFFFQKFKKTYSPEKVLTSIRTEVDKLLKEIMREAESDVTLIEARIQGLKDLIAQADERILCAEKEISKRAYEKKVLSDLNEKKAPSEKKTAVQRKLGQYTAFSSVKPPIDPVLIESAMQQEFSSGERTEPQQASVYGNYAPDVQPSVAASPVENSASLNAASPAVVEYPDVEVVVPQAVFNMEQPEILRAKEPIQPKQSPRDRILELYNMNFAAEIISEKLKIPLSEVQVVINLYLARN